MTNPFDDDHSGQPKSMEQLKALFGGTGQSNEPGFRNQITVLEEGNVGKKKPKKTRVTADGNTVEVTDSDSSVEEDVLPEEAVQTEQGPQSSFIQILFESQIKRKFEED